jgi:transposase
MIKCPCCGSTDVISRGIEKRVIRGVPAIGTKFIYFNVSIPIVECRDCGNVRQIDPGIAEPKKRYTKAFAKAAVMLVFITSMNSAAALLGVSWHMINDIIQSHL